MFAESNLGVLGGTSRSPATVGSNSSSSGGGALRRPLGTLGSSIGSSLLYGTAAEEKIVLDIGTHTLRVGYSGDARPLYKTSLYSVFSHGDNNAGRLVGKSSGLFEEGHPNNNEEELLEALLVEQLRNVYRSHLLLDSKSRKVVVAEGALLPVQVKRALARVLFYNLRVPMVSFYPGSVTSLMTCGKMVGLVVDCGHRSTAVMPVYDCRPLVSCMVSTPMGGNALFRNLKQLVLRFGKFVPFGGGQTKKDGDVKECAVDELALSDDTVRFLMTKLIYASPIAIPKSFGRPPPGLSVGIAEGDLVEWFESSITASNEVTKLTVDCPKNGRGSLMFPTWIRERAAEILFSGDMSEDHQGIVQSIVQSIAKSPVDTRRELVKNILVVGGVADMLNFKVRLLHDLISTLRDDKRWSALAGEAALANEDPVVGLSANGEAFLASDRCWTGASLAVAARIGGMDVKAEEFDDVSIIDWTNQ
ncbi:hypothetical protein GGF39_003943 [Coemansia sp. RSA 1721]|nr:hypothetical protein GGF39_003943 [Coemansia sp. RSA 1721]